MPNCPHGNFIKDIEDTTSCSLCNTENYKKRKFVNRSKKEQETKFRKQKPSELNNLKARAQSLHSKNIKTLHCDQEYTRCWTCNKLILVYGGSIHNTSHCGHYYPKSLFWELAYLDFNSGIQCYDCNVNHPELIPIMRDVLISFWGVDKINLLDSMAKEFKWRVDSGIITKQPPTEWIREQIKILKSKGK
jgi:hypothetical protein